MNIENPFGILKIPANASAAEIKSAGKMMVARLRLSDATNVTQIRAIELASEQLRDPVARFKLGLEWPSLGPEAAHLLATDSSLSVRSLERWTDRAAAIERLVDGESLLSRQHIWAVFMLRHAQEVFIRAIARQESSLSDASKAELRNEASSFVAAINQWNSATTKPQFWMAQRMRAKEINDPRVGAELIAACQGDIFSIAIHGFVILASDALRVRNAAVCSAIVDSINCCGASRVDIEKALADVYSQLCAGASGALNNLKAKLRTATSKSPEPYRKLLLEYSQVIHPDIALMLAVGDLPGTSEKICRDLAAEFLRNLAVDAANNADAYKISMEALTAAQLVAYSEQIRTTLKADIDAVSKLLAQGNHAGDRRTHFDQFKAAMARILKRTYRLLPVLAVVDEACRLTILWDALNSDGIVMPITRAPTLKTINGFGTAMYGQTVCLVLLHIPVLAFGRYQVQHLGFGRYSFAGKMRLRPWQRIYNCAAGIYLCIVVINAMWR